MGWVTTKPSSGLHGQSSGPHTVCTTGDTGYSSHFEQIGERLGPFDLTLIKAGAYGPGQAWLDVHMEPEPAMQAHLDVGGQSSDESSPIVAELDLGLPDSG